MACCVNNSLATSALMVVVILAAMGVVAEAYPSGPPLSACSSMIPTGHGTSTVVGSVPFTVAATQSYYTAGEEIEVTISGSNFIGFFVQARRRDSGADTSAAVGTMGSIDAVLAKTLNCNGVTASAWSHKSNALKSSITATWTAPSSDEGTIAFRATIVQGPSSDKFWTNVFSDDITFGNSTDEMQTPTVTPTPGSGNTICLSFVLLLASLTGAVLIRI